jgi:hypothetical protein
MDLRFTARLGNLLHTLDKWLVPTVADQCGQVDAAKLKAFRANLSAIADDLAAVEEGQMPDSLAACLDTLAEGFAKWHQGVALEPEAVVGICAIITEAATSAFALELALRRATGTARPDDWTALRLAAALSRKGLTVGMPETAQRGGAA